MLVDNLTLITDATIHNAHVEIGTTFPNSPTIGRMFYLSADIEDPSFDKGLYIYDGTEWQSGDITGIIAGTGLTGGGLSGTVTLNIDPDAILPSQSNNTGKYLTTNGTSPSWGVVTETSPGGTYTSTGDANYANVSLLLHGDGENNAFVFTDNAFTPKTILSSGGTCISTTQSKFGGSSLYNNANAGYLYSNGASDFAFGTGNFTVEFWFKLDSLTGYNTHLFHTGGVGDFSIVVDTTGERKISILFNGWQTGTTAIGYSGAWYHLAVCRVGTTVTMYLNGTQDLQYTGDNTNYTVANAGPYIMGYPASYGFIGYLDDIRITKGVARYTANFTPPINAFPNNSIIAYESIQLNNNGSFGGLSTFIFDTTNNYLGVNKATPTQALDVVGNIAATGTITATGVITGSNISGTNTGNQTITLTGDVTGSGTGSFSTTLANSGVSANTYKSVTVDIKGRVTAGTNPTTLDGYGITDAAPSSHLTDYTLHLTSGQNTWIDAITATSAEVNYSVGVTSLIQTQFGGKLNLTGGSMTGSIVIPTGAHITVTDAPSSGTDAVNRNYVDSNIAGLSWKNAVKAASIEDIDLTTGGLLTIDTVVLLSGNRVLVKNQALPEQNGIYVAAAGAWSRSTDMDQTTPINEINSAAVFVEKGYVNADYGWTQVNNITTLGDDPILFTQFNGAANITAGIGLLKTGNVLDINLGAGIVQLPTDEVGVDLYSTGGLMTTVDGTASSTSTNSQLSLTKVGTAGTYKSVTTDAYGRITAGTNPTSLSGYGITDAAPIASPTFTGTPTLPTGTIATTQTAGNNTTAVATTAFVTTAVTTVGYQFFTATASQTAFTFTNFTNVTGTHRLQVFVDGVKQIEPGNGAASSYAETSSTIITFVAGLDVGQYVECYFR
jgi:phage-related tail fiber protein